MSGLRMPVTILQLQPRHLLQEVNGKHLLKAEPLNAILDPQYFIRQVHECVVRVLNDRAAKEHQVASQSSFYRYIKQAIILTG